MAERPLLAQSGHRLVHRKCLREGVKPARLLTGQFNHSTRNGFNRGWKRFGFILLAEGQNLRRILLQAVIVENAAIRGRVVITAHPVLHELLCVRRECKPLAASYVIHVQINLCRARYCSGGQGYGNNYNFAFHDESPLRVIATGLLHF